MPELLASDDNNPAFVGAHNPDDLLYVKFYKKPVHQPFLSEQEKRPIFKDVDFIEIRMPGNQLNDVRRPVFEDDKRRFHRIWALYEAGKVGDEQIIGTPVAQWPRLSPSQAEELKALKFFTVEQIAGASDERLMTIGMWGGMAPSALRDKAKQFLALAKGDALAEKQEAQLKERDDKIAKMQEQIQQLLDNAAAGGNVSQPASEKKTLHLNKDK